MLNPFETLGLAPSFAIEPSLLEQRQRELNRALHPDRHAGKAPAERRLALSRAMDVNQAYRRLRDPASRAEALFDLLGVNPLSDRASVGPGLLGEMLEQREQLEEVRRNKDAALLGTLSAHMTERERAIIADLERAFAALLESAGASPLPAGERGPELERAQRLLMELRYVRRFTEEVAAIQDEL